MNPAVLGKRCRRHLLARATDAGRRRVAARQLWAISAGASVWLIDLEPYERCRMAGVRSLRVDPVEGYIEVTITDGTGQVAARWPIREPAPELAIAPGMAVVLDGVAAVGDDGRLTLQEPGFQAIPYSASG